MKLQAGFLLPFIALVSACGGGGEHPALVSSCGGNGFCPSAPAPTPPAPNQLFKDSGEVSYSSIGGAQKLIETVGKGELYTAGQLPLASNTVSIAFDERSAVFTVKYSAEDAGVSARYQDPAHRTDFGGGLRPQGNVPNLPNTAYLESGSATDTTKTAETFFYEVPGAKTRYVTLSGYVRNSETHTSDVVLERTRGVAAFGNLSRTSDMPKTGSATYSGSMLATLVSTDLDRNPALRSRFEWVSGTASTAVDFSTGKINSTFGGTVVATSPALEDVSFGAMTAPHSGAAFTASGTATIDGTGIGYAGKINSATFAGAGINIAASSLDGAFYGPGAVETGGAFRIVGATPDTRVDFIGAFTGAKP